MIGSINNADDVVAAREESLEQLAGRHRLVVVEVHFARGGKELIDRLLGDAELLRDDAREVLPIEARPQGELRVFKSNPLELHDALGDLRRPVFAAAT